MSIVFINTYYLIKSLGQQLLLVTDANNNVLLPGIGNLPSVNIIKRRKHYRKSFPQLLDIAPSGSEEANLNFCLNSNFRGTRVA